MGYTPVGHALQDGRYHRVEVALAPGRCKDCRVETKRGYFGTQPTKRINSLRALDRGRRERLRAGNAEAGEATLITLD